MCPVELRARWLFLEEKATYHPAFGVQQLENSYSCPTDDSKLITTVEELQAFMEVCNRYDYWVASPEENAAVGISLF
jgi:hypothetical protein